MRTERTAPALPPVIVGSRRAGDGRLFLNTGIDAHNSALLTIEPPVFRGPIVPRKVLSGLRVALLVGTTTVAAAFLPIDTAQLPLWVIGAWVGAFILYLVASALVFVLEVGGALRGRKDAKAIKTWRVQLESALYGHREQLLSLKELAEQPHFPAVQAFIGDLDSARTRILAHATGDGHDRNPGHTDLLHALGGVSRYAQDPTPGRHETAQNAVINFQRTAIELTSREGTP